MDLTKLSTEELQKLYKASYGAIYVTECYGVNDLRALMGASNELEKREIKINITTKHEVNFENGKLND